jgi:hypothetical protein
MAGDKFSQADDSASHDSKLQQLYGTASMKMGTGHQSRGSLKCSPLFRFHGGYLTILVTRSRVLC